MPTILETYYQDVKVDHPMAKDYFYLGAGAVICFIQSHMEQGHSLSESFDLMQKEIELVIEQNNDAV